MNHLQFAHVEYSMTTKSLDIFSIGCDANPKCVGCCNPQIWDWQTKGYNVNYVIKKVKTLITEFPTLIDRFILVGGDPVDAYRRYKKDYQKLLWELNNLYRPVYLFTRHQIEDIDKDLFNFVDYVKTGEYNPDLICDNNIQYGIKLATSNQKIIEVDKWIQNN